MKTILTTILLSLTVLVQGQRISIVDENNITGMSSMGIQLTNHQGWGWYVTAGGNQVAQFLNLHHRYDWDVQGSFSSTVSWYDKNGSNYPVMSGPLFTEARFGNTLLETGNCKNVVETTDQWTTEKHSFVTTGVVIPVQKYKVRVGVGLHREIITGTKKYHKWTHNYNVSLYKDNWDAVPGGFHVVETTKSITEVRGEEVIDINRVVPNVNFSFLFPIFETVDMSLGYDSHNSLNFGFTYNFK